MRVVCCSVPKRRAVVEYLRLHIPDLIVSEDTERRGGWWNFSNSLVLAEGEALLHLEDDITLTTDFMAKVTTEVERFDGKVVINGFSQAPFERSHVAPGRSFMSTLCVYLPPGYAERLLNFMPIFQVNGTKGWWNGGRRHYDLALRTLLQEHGLRYWLVHPNLVDHMPIPSASGHPGGRRSPTFRDPELRGHPYPELLEVAHAH